MPFVPPTCLLLTLLSLAAPSHAFLSGSSGINVDGHTKLRPISQLLASKSDANREDDENLRVSSRRKLLHEAGVLVAGSVSSGPFLSFFSSFSNDQDYSKAGAMGLVHFPCPQGVLMNKYHLMRAGESGLEQQNLLSTNPLFLTNTEDGLTALGLMQVEDACSQLLANNVNPSVIKYSLASKCIDTANAVANTLLVGRNRIVPEFTFMDPRVSENSCFFLFLLLSS